MRGSAAGRRRSPQPAGLREVVRGAPLRQGRPKGAGEPQAPVGCRGYPHARLCRWATVVAAAREGCTSEHGRRAGASTLHAEMRSAWSGPKRGPEMRPRAARRAAGGGKGCSPTPGPPKGGGGRRLPWGAGGYPHARLCRRATVVAAAAEAAHRSSVMSGSEWTRAEMRSAWSGPGRDPGKCPRAACLPGRGVQGSPCKLPRSQPRGCFAAVPFEHERRRARANERRHDCCLHAAARRARPDRRPVAGKACGDRRRGR